MNDNNPNMNRKRTTFFIFREFSLSGFFSKETEHQNKPTSVTRTNGMNQIETISIISGIGDRQTAKMKNIAAAKAAFLLPKTTAKVLILCCLSPSMSTMPLVISRPVFDRKAMDAKSSMLIVTVLTATRLPKRNGAATQALTRRFPGNPPRFPIVE